MPKKIKIISKFIRQRKAMPNRTHGTGEPALTDALKNKTQLQLIRNR